MGITDIVGYIAMTFLVVSFIPKQVKRIRVINFIGCVFFVAYGILLGWALPIIISNGFVAIIQVYHLINFKKEVVQE